MGNIPNSNPIQMNTIRSASGNTGTISLNDSDPRLIVNKSSAATQSLSDYKGGFWINPPLHSYAVAGTQYEYYMNEYYHGSGGMFNSGYVNAQNYALLNGNNLTRIVHVPSSKFVTQSTQITFLGSDITDWTYINVGDVTYLKANAGNATSTVHNSQGYANYTTNGYNLCEWTFVSGGPAPSPSNITDGTATKIAGA